MVSYQSMQKDFVFSRSGTTLNELNRKQSSKNNLISVILGANHLALVYSLLNLFMACTKSFCQIQSILVVSSDTIKLFLPLDRYRLRCPVTSAGCKRWRIPSCSWGIYFLIVFILISKSGCLIHAFLAQVKPSTFMVSQTDPKINCC